MKATAFVAFVLAGLLVGCSTASQQVGRHVYGPEDVATREAQYERLLAELEHTLDHDTFVQMRTLWQQRARAEAELQRVFADSGITFDSDYYKLKCGYLDAVTDMLRMLKKDAKPNHAVELTAVRSAASGSSP